jgi:serine/threonine protein kinase
MSEPASTTPDTPRRAGEHAAGDVLDQRYRLVSRIGRGGFGDVWRAEELLPDGAPFREVALKLLLAGGDAGSWAEEAKLLASFRHPSLVTIYAAGILATQPPQRFVAMELLEGGNLAELLKVRGRIPWRRALRWACNTAAALDVIHPVGVVHLDLKPANLFLCTDGALKVLDFGISRRAGSKAAPVGRGRATEALATMPAGDAEMGTAVFLAQSEALAATQAFTPENVGSRAGGTQQAVVGTPGFIAPEVLEMAEPTAAADAYALAVCLVQIITGRLPHAAEDEPERWDDPTEVSAWLDGLRQATLRGTLRDFDADPRLFPRGLAALTRRLLAIDPRQRGVSPGKLGELLDGAWQRPHGVPDPPYPGLAAYGPEMEGLLFGRDDDIARLGRELSYEPSLVLQGARGAGKSSLAAAGIVPYLGLRGVDGKDNWIAARVVPGSDPDQALAEALAAVDPELAKATGGELAAHCAQAAVGLVIVVDPLDELLAAPAEKRARIEALIATIAEATAVADPEGKAATGEDHGLRATLPGLRLIAALAEEHTGALLESEALGASLRASLRFVGAPPVAAVRDIVGAPAHFAGVPVAGVEEIVADVQQELRAGSTRLPFVALALRAFWTTQLAPPETPRKGAAERSDRRAGAPISLRGERWKELGGVSGALARHAERALNALSTDDRRVALELMLRLSATDGTLVIWPASELLGTFGAADDQATAARVLALLIHEHLVRRQGEALELGHPSLASLRLLGSARLEHMERLALLERLREAALAWERAESPRDLLAQGAFLAELEARRALLRSGLAPRERAFLAASRKRARLLALGRGATVLAALLVVTLGVLAKTWVDAAHESEAQARAAAIELERTAELAAKSRRTEDPFLRAAYISAAMDRGSTDGMLPFDLASTVGRVARADFLTLGHVTGAAFPWDEHWLVAQSSGSTLSLVNFRPAEPEVIEDTDLDVDPELAAKHFRFPQIAELRPHADPIAERVHFAFDSAFATRSVSGEVKVFRLRNDGSAALAAVAPLRCAGAMRLAEAAPVLACATEEGIARWDLRRAAGADHGVDRHAFQGNVADVSPDGARVAATEASRVLLWAPDEKREASYTAQAPVVHAAWSPRDPVLAVVEAGGFELVDFAAGSGRIVTTPLLRESLDTEPSTVRWDDGGLDLAICDPTGQGRWFYLKKGGRLNGDPLPQGTPCSPQQPPGQPAFLLRPTDFDELATHDLGPHSPLRGWKLGNHRYLTRQLVLFNAEAPAASRLLRFQGHDGSGGEEPLGATDSAAAVERIDGNVAWQVGNEVRVYSLPEGRRLLSRKGNLLRRCSDGRLLAWAAAGASYQLFEVWKGNAVASVPREPGLVLGTDSACTRLYTQRLDGTLLVTPFAGGAPRVLAMADGYVYDVHPARARSPVGPGLWLSVSSGAIARLDETRDQVSVLGYATPRAEGLSDGPRPGDLVYADAGGIVVKNILSGATERVLEATGDSPWEDLSVSPDGASMILASADRLAVLDVARREIVGTLPSEGRSRLSRWDDDGSLIAWCFDRVGGPEGQIIPRGVPLAKKVASAVSNLGVDKGKLGLRK